MVRSLRPSSLASSSATAEYLREARRVRARKLSPVARQAALRALTPPVRSAPESAPTVLTFSRTRSSAVPLLSIPPATAEAFSAEVAEHVRSSGGILRFTARRQLLARATRLRIRPFEANLLIASVMHAHRSPQALPQAETRISGFHLMATVALLIAMVMVAVWF